MQPALKWYKNVAVVGLTLASLTLTGCAASAGKDGSGRAESRNLSCTNKIVNPDVEQVSVWAWYPEFESVVDEYNKNNDDVQICWNNAGVGADEYTKLNTALAAGSGAADVVMLEAAMLPSYTVQDSLVDLTPFGAADIKKNFSPGAWADVSTTEGVFAAPVDGGPMGMLYRSDIFKQYNVAVPTTWAEFADSAQQLKDNGYPGFITNFPTNGRAYIQALFSQAGAVPYTVDPDDPSRIGIDLESPEVLQVLNYWNDLIERGLVSHNDRNTSDDNARMLDGTYASYIAPAWGPGYLAGLADPGAVTEWRAVPLPQWDANKPVQVNWGGSSFAVTNQAPNPALSAKVAMGIFGSEATWKIGIEKATLFPLWSPMLESDYFRDLDYAFFGGQQINEDVFIDAAASYEGFTNLPFLSLIYDTTTEGLYAMAEGTQTPEETVTSLQKTFVDYAENQGFTVN